MSNFSIRDLAKFSGLQQHTIRTWEQRFSFLKPERNKALRRQYSPREIDLFMDIIFLHQNGYKVSQIATMTDVEKANSIKKISTSSPHQKVIHELIIYMTTMDIEGFELTMNNAICNFGLLISIENILLPFAEKVGMFDTEECKNYIGNIGLIANPLKEKLLTGIGYLKDLQGRGDNVIIFSLHSQINHLQLDFLHYFLKKAGFMVINPAPQLSIDQLELICAIKNPGYIVIDCYGEENDEVVKSLNSRIVNCCSSAKVFILSNHPAVNGYLQASNVKGVMDIILADQPANRNRKN